MTGKGELKRIVRDVAEGMVFIVEQELSSWQQLPLASIQ